MSFGYLCVFFFQAEDGIRDLVRSRGLGDVYKRQVQGRFPTVFDPVTGLPQGPLHRLPRADVWLGPWVSAERDADQMPDEDSRPNLDPILNQADQDRFDDGVKMPVGLADCQSNTFDFTVAAQPGAARGRIVNVWFDFNQDGDWEDTIQCANGLVAQELSLIHISEPTRPY